MKGGRTSLLAGRNTAPLSDNDIRRVGNTFYGLDREAVFAHADGENTRCRVIEVEGEIVCEIRFGADIFPGKSVVDPNSALSMRAAAAHELSHLHRWRDKTELDGDHLVEIDEALTDLEAILRYYPQLNENEIRQLIADAIQRLQIFAQRHPEGFATLKPAPNEV
ncbi:hypothetical protein CDO28_20165 (plasmid) [Sinorhizobium meliloti]|uniref:hypothetical protein n=1 Tax=Rhizobium meliloti TaxID=382 RepID=UPI000B498290|nr:hypothetical protein [Sinorhizobium meliloti]ASP73865.1 hypothetical protein CDO28_20165 [Sinorhizobium meliloti]MDE3858118.1 hypothetical protein [Sinorhizobium meliloti]MQW53399.1 hypothetical protein [Sinorhizobium meliloti]